MPIRKNSGNPFGEFWMMNDAISDPGDVSCADNGAVIKYVPEGHFSGSFPEQEIQFLLSAFT